MTLDTFSATWISPIRNVTASMLTAFFDSIVGSGPARGQQHRGLDIAVPVGTPVYAPRDAKVKKVEFQPTSGGHVVTLEHEGGYTSVYAHLSEILVRVGDTVSQGTEIAKSGESGAVTGPHLHWELARNGLNIDPLDIFDPFTDTPDNVYRGRIDELVQWMEDKLRDDIGNKTWGEWAAGPFNADFIGSPLQVSFGTALNRAVRELEWQDRTIQDGDIAIIAEKILDLVPSVNIDPIAAAGDAITTIASAFGFLLDPQNWARILALIAGSVIAFVGFRTMWEATNS